MWRAGRDQATRTFVEGQFLDTVCGIPDSRTEIVMLKSPAMAPAWSSHASCDPTPCRAFEVDDLQAAVD